MIQKKILRWLLQSNDSRNLPEFIPMIADWLARIGSISEAWVKPEAYKLSGSITGYPYCFGERRFPVH